MNETRATATGQRSAIGRAAGFTLIELLIVVAIIGILVGMLVPVIGMVRDRGHAIACLGNLRNMGVAMLSRANDNHQTLAAPLGETVTYSFTSTSGAAVDLPVTYPPSPNNAGGIWYRFWQYQCYGFAYDLRNEYGLTKSATRCPADRLPWGGNHQKQAWSWDIDGQRSVVESDPDYFSSYCANFELLFNYPNLATLQSPSLTILASENAIPNAPWFGMWGPDFASCIHGRGRNFHLGESNCFQGQSIFADGHAERWDWQRCAYFDTASLELTDNPSRYSTGVADAFPGVARLANLRF